MQDKEAIIKTLTNHYSVKVISAFGQIKPASKALEVVANSLNEIYRYFEPSFFNGDFFLCKSLDDTLCFDESKGKPIYDKNFLLDYSSGLLIIQVFNESGKMILWENQDPNNIIKQGNVLTYLFQKNKETFFANGSTIDITINDKGSRFATQYADLAQALNVYSHSKIKKSSCPHFAESWSDGNRLFFRGGGRGNNIPEKFMQKSLYEFLSTYTTLLRGISIEASREHNLLGVANAPKPVDVKIHWKEANRTAMIEIKFLGTVKLDSDGSTYKLLDPRANVGISQLKGYHDKAATDSPTTINKSYLIVFDGRRNNLNDTDVSILCVDGLFYKDVEIVIDADKKYHETIVGFEKPIRMFAEPICT